MVECKVSAYAPNDAEHQNRKHKVSLIQFVGLLVPLRSFSFSSSDHGMPSLNSIMSSPTGKGLKGMEA